MIVVLNYMNVIHPEERVRATAVKLPGNRFRLDIRRNLLTGSSVES